MTVYDVIDRKKRGFVLTEEEVRFFVRAVADGRASDAQIAAFCMAVVWRGMTDEECFFLTDAMTHSGETIPRPRLNVLFADKHSTGGVSDSTSLVLVPVLAACGVHCAKYSGRGLGHTGGTLDKLESFPGFRVSLTAEEFEAQAERVGCVIAGQTARIVPADKRMYAVRDVTATVDSIPLIAASVMSKKLASFADVILLDVKYGEGAFVHGGEEAVRLARTMVDLGRRAGRRMCACVTCMDQPLGDSIGCCAEVREAIGVLRGEVRNDLSELSLSHSALLLQTVLGISAEEAARRAQEAVDSGAALQKLREMVAAQGGDARAVDDFSLLPLAEGRAWVRAKADGYLRVAATSLGRACVELGGGRLREEDAVDHGVGLRLLRRTGEAVRAGDPLAEVYFDPERDPAGALSLIEGAFAVGGELPPRQPLVYCTIAEEDN